MNIIKKFLGPKSKYDRKLPYTYIAKVPEIEGDEELYSYYFADTICGLIEYLDELDISPENVELFGLYLHREIPLEKEYCTASGDRWLRRPEICKSLEEHYSQTLESRYRGHSDKKPCAFDDRDRKGSGPF